MTTTLNIPLSTAVEKAIATAQAKAREYHHAQFSAGHLLWALLRDEDDVLPFLEGIGKDAHRLRAWADLRIENTPKSARSVETPTADERVQAVLQEAFRLRTTRGHAKVSSLLVLEVLCTPDVGFTAEQLRRMPLSLVEVQDARQKLEALRAAIGSDLAPTVTNGSAAPRDVSKASHTEGSAKNANPLEKYCDDLTSRARQGKIDPVIGRDEELKKLVEYLGKRISPNIIIVGEPGVGKTAIVGGLALNILSGKVPERLKNASIFELDVSGRLVAGAYKGEVEERLKAVLQAIKAQSGNAILFIDEIHTLLDPNGSVGSGAVNLLKPELARGELTVIGATTAAEFRQFFDGDPAFKRRFTELSVAEPNELLAVEMLKGLVNRYETFHKVALESDALPLAVQLAKRYLGEKRLPSSALEILDVTMSAVAVLNDTNPTEIAELEREWTVEVKNLIETDKAQYETRSKHLDAALKNRISHLLTQKFDSDTEGVDFAHDFEQKLAQLKAWTAQPKMVVNADDVAATVAYMTQIPMGKIQSAEQRKLLDMEKLLQKRVVGQAHALETVANALRRSRSGLREANKPAAAFFFLGPTGTGKTELSKAIAELLFNDSASLIRFDMSEFKEKNSVALLYGSPPGYVGYKEGGLLVNKIRRNPYSVVLFDEIEKADKSVYDVFLQILDEGKLSDKLGNQGDFSKSIVIFTSNIGSQWIMDKFEAEEVPTEDALRKVMADAEMPDRTKAFRPEFLARSLKLIPFAPITEGVATTILDIHLRNFGKLLAQQGIGFSYTEGAKMALIASGFNKEYGARPLKDTIEDRLATPLSDKIISGELAKDNSVEVDWSQEQEQFIWNIFPSKK